MVTLPDWERHSGNRVFRRDRIPEIGQSVVPRCARTCMSGQEDAD